MEKNITKADQLRKARAADNTTIIATYTAPDGSTVNITVADVARGVSISRDNKKMDAIPSVSLPAVITCNRLAPCACKDSPCYAQHMEKNGVRGASIRRAWYKNYYIYKTDPDAYFRQVKAAALLSTVFRYHVGGDIPDADYFRRMVKLAREVKTCRFLAFTKQHDIVNYYIAHGGKIPKNLIVIFSSWFNWKCLNPYNLPVCEVVNDENPPAPTWYICGGSCMECNARGVGCWQLKHGETIAIYEH